MGAVVHHRTHGSINKCFLFVICHPGVPQDDRWNNFSNSKELIAKKN
jgi:hypothetical protein